MVVALKSEENNFPQHPSGRLLVFSLIKQDLNRESDRAINSFYDNPNIPLAIGNFANPSNSVRPSSRTINFETSATPGQVGRSKRYGTQKSYTDQASSAGIIIPK